MSKVVINLSTGMEDAEKVMIAFLVGGAAAAQGKQVAMFLTKDAIFVANTGHAHGSPCEGCPPIDRLVEQYAKAGGELLVCPICMTSRGMDDSQFQQTRATPAPPRCGNGSATSPRPSSATDPQGRD
jgi:predicted peroxiredoxin